MQVQRFHSPMVARDRVYFAATNLTAFTIGGVSMTATPAVSSATVALSPPSSTAATPSPAASQPASAPSAGAPSHSAGTACLMLLAAAALMCSL